MFVRNTWYVAAWAHEIADQLLARRICNEPVVLFRDMAGNIAALEDRCCHRGVPLSLGKVVNQGLQCGYHGLVIDAAGKCVHIPGQDKIPQRAKVKSYPVVEKDGLIWLWPGSPEKADASKIVDYPYHNDHKQWPYKPGFYHVEANYMLLVDNFMDLTHVAYVHADTIGGNPEDHINAKMEVSPTDTGLKFERWMLDSVPAPVYAKAGNFVGNVDRWQELEYIAPGVVRQWSGSISTGQRAYEDGNRSGGISLRFFHGVTPETETSCFYFWSAANGYRQDEPEATQQLYEAIAHAFLEDKIIVEGQQARLTEFGEDTLVDIASDRIRVQMRRTVDRLLHEEEHVPGSAALTPRPLRHSESPEQADSQ